MTAPSALSPWLPTPRRMTQAQADRMLAHLQQLGWAARWQADGSLQLTHTSGRTILRHADTTLTTIRVLEAQRAGLTPLDARQAGLIRQLHELRVHIQMLRKTL